MNREGISMTASVMQSGGLAQWYG